MKNQEALDRDRIRALLVLFGLREVFSEAQLRQAYRDLVQVWHPDRQPQNERLRRKAEEMLKEINEGERLLSSLLVNGRFDLPSFAPDGASERAAPAEPRDGRRSGDRRPQADALRFLGLKFTTLYLILGALLVVAVGMAVWGRKAGAAPVAAVKAVVVKSARLDERNGFKQFVFGMSAAEARAIQAPDEDRADEPTAETLLAYTRGASVTIGDYPLSRVELRFTRDRLYRIEIRFSRNQDRVYSAFAAAFGEPGDDPTQQRAGSPVRARVWTGDKVIGLILADPGTLPNLGWDSVVLTHRNYAEESIDAQRGGQKAIFSDDGFKALKFGMSVAGVRELFGRNLKAIVDGGAGGERIDLPAAAARGLAGVGVVPVEEIRCHFFQDALYRIDLVFSKEEDALHRAFVLRFPSAMASTTWTRGTAQLRALQATEAGHGAVILGPQAATTRWDRILLFDVKITQERKAYNDSAATRAAADI